MNLSERIHDYNDKLENDFTDEERKGLITNFLLLHFKNSHQDGIKFLDDFKKELDNGNKTYVVKKSLLK